MAVGIASRFTFEQPDPNRRAVQSSANIASSWSVAPFEPGSDNIVGGSRLSWFSNLAEQRGDNRRIGGRERVLFHLAG